MNKAKGAGKKLGPEAYKEHVKTIFSPTPVQLHKIKMVKDPGSEDFGFGLSDGMYEKGVYISGVKEESLAEKAGLNQFDRILQVMLLNTTSSLTASPRNREKYFSLYYATADLQLF